MRNMQLIEQTAQEKSGGDLVLVEVLLMHLHYNWGKGNNPRETRIDEPHIQACLRGIVCSREPAGEVVERGADLLRKRKVRSHHRRHAANERRGIVTNFRAAIPERLIR